MKTGFSLFSLSLSPSRACYPSTCLQYDTLRHILASTPIVQSTYTSLPIYRPDVHSIPQCRGISSRTTSPTRISQDSGQQPRPPPIVRSCTNEYTTDIFPDYRVVRLSRQNTLCITPVDGTYNGTLSSDCRSYMQFAGGSIGNAKSGQEPG